MNYPGKLHKVSPFLSGLNVVVQECCYCPKCLKKGIELKDKSTLASILFGWAWAIPASAFYCNTCKKCIDPVGLSTIREIKLEKYILENNKKNVKHRSKR